MSSTSISTRLLARIGGLGLTGVAVVALGACGSTQAADFTEDGVDPSATGTSQVTQEEPAPVELQPVESGFLTEDFDEGLTFTETIRPEQGEILTPAGTLEFRHVQSIESISPGAARLAPALPDGTEILSYGPADGEVLRVVELAFTPAGDIYLDQLPGADLSVTIGGSQKHLGELLDTETLRLLASVPDDGSVQLVVSSEGHDQNFDLLTGERAEDDVAAAYYRSGALQEPHHTIKVDSTSLPTDSGTGPEDDVVTDFSFDVESAMLTAWNEEGGWAEPGTAWLGVTWAYDLRTNENGHLTQFKSLNAVASIDVDGEVTTDQFHADRGYGTTGIDGERIAWVSVPVDTTSASISFSGDFMLEIPMGQGVTITGDGTGTFASDSYEITFPTGD